VLTTQTVGFPLGTACSQNTLLVGTEIKVPVPTNPPQVNWDGTVYFSSVSFVLRLPTNAAAVLVTGLRVGVYPVGLPPGDAIFRSEAYPAVLVNSTVVCVCLRLYRVV